MSPAQRARFDFTATVPAAADLGAVHFVAVGGSGMSGVARLFLAHGASVSGSDQQDSPTLQALAQEGVRVHVGHNAAHLGQADTVIVSGAVRDSNPELVAAHAQGLRVLHRAQGIAALLVGRSAVAVAGANGKTTTSAMLTVALQTAGADPAYVLGSPLVGQGSNAAPGSGPVVVEADESDGSFVVYRPQVGVVTNITADHLDLWGDLAGVRQAFRDFADTIAPDGVLVTNADDPGARDLAAYARERGQTVVTWGSDPGADLVLEHLELTGSSAAAQVRWTRALSGVGAGTRHRLEVPMPGEHNVHNAAAALLAATAGLGRPVQPVLAGLAGFPGTRRRFEHLGAAGGVEVVDDYAHNPDKVTAVVRAGRAVLGASGRLVVAFQPHLYTRTRRFAAEFAAALRPADVVLLLEIYGAREEALRGVSSELIAEQLRQGPAPRPEVHTGLDPATAPEAVARLVQPGDLVLTVGAGDVTTVGPALLEWMTRRHATSTSDSSGRMTTTKTTTKE